MSSVIVDPGSWDLASIAVHEGDLDERTFDRALRGAVLGWDTETTGLDWRTERIAVVQLQLDDVAAIVRVNGKVPWRLKALLEDPSVLKIMHHATFDLRFMVHNWDASPNRVACTKIASKLAFPGATREEHSLAALVRRFFGVGLDKSQRTSDWLTADLSDEQLRYAANDVRYLWPLHEELDNEIRRRGLVSLRDRCYAHLATRVELELRGYPDVFEY